MSVAAAGVILLALLAAAGGAAAQSRTVVLATTTSTQDSGLLDVLVPAFERQTGYAVKTIAVGTGQALALAARGEADVALAHAPALERRYVQEGKLLNRRLVMVNDFVLVGPPEDPAGVRGAPGAAAALRRIATARARFVSRGDGSGTHQLDRRAYTLTDRATLLAFQRRVGLAILLEADRPLVNLYAVLEVNPANGPRVNAAGGKAFADFLVSPAAQALIRTFGVDRYGQPLFLPVAGKRLALGASRAQLLWVLVREARLPMLAALMAGFGAVISEVGASMMVGGNLRGQTRVLTTATVLETGRGNFEVAIALSVILLTITFLVNWALTWIQQRPRP